MPENEFSSRKNGRGEDAAQNQKHLDELTADELTDVLSDMWDGMDESNYDSTQMDACLAELEKREPSTLDFDVDASLAAFQEKHARLFEQTPPVQLSIAAKPAHRRRWRTSLVAAIVAAVMMLCSMVTAQAFGFDIFGAIARWTEETFHFSISAQPPDSQQNIPAPAEGGEYGILQEALDAYGITEPVAPRWYPSGFQTVEIHANPRSTGVTIQAHYEAGEKSLSVSVRQYSTEKDASISIGSFEKDSGDVIRYEYNGIVHYVMTNNSENFVTWTNDALVCSIWGDVTVDELKQMVNSIYEG